MFDERAVHFLVLDLNEAKYCNFYVYYFVLCATLNVRWTGQMTSKRRKRWIRDDCYDIDYSKSKSKETGEFESAFS